MPRRASSASIKAKRRSNLALVVADRAFGIGIEMAREIGHRKEQIADLFARVGRVALGQGAFDLVGLFADFGQHRARVMPIETDRRGLALQLDGAGEAGKGKRHIRQQARRFGRLILRFGSGGAARRLFLRP